MKLRSYLIALVLVVMLPLLVFATAMAGRIAENYRETAENGLSNAAQGLSLAIGREIESVQASLSVLASSPSLDAPDLQMFYEFAKMFAQARGSWVTVTDRGGQEVVMTQRPFGSALPRTAISDIIDKVFKTGEATISDLFTGAAVRRPIFVVAVPAVRNGRVIDVLDMPVDPARLSRILAEQQLPGRATAVLVDGKGKVLARAGDEAGRDLGQSLAEVPRAGSDLFEDVVLNGTNMVMAHARVEGTGWTLGVAAPADDLQMAWRGPVKLLALGGLALVGVACILALFVGGFLLRPVHVLTDFAARAMTGQIHPEPRPARVAEFGVLWDALKCAAVAQARSNEALEKRVQERTQELFEANRRLAVEITQRERAEEELLQKRKIEAIGQLAAGVAHDFNNLLTAVIGNLELLRNKLTGDLRRLANSAFHAAERGATLTGHLLAFGRRQRLEMKPVSLNAFIEGVAPLLRHVLGPLVEVELRLGLLNGVVALDQAQMELALLNLALNSRDAMPEGGRIVLETRSLRVTAQQEHAVVGPGDWTELCFADTGGGMTTEVKARAFDPFFTTKDVGKGTGLGLSMVHGLVKQLNAEIAISSEVGQGTVVHIYFPRAKPDEAKPSAVPTRRVASSGRILVVDDDPDALQFMLTLLEGAGHKVAWAASGRAALDLIDAQDPPSLVVLDYAMPEMNGLAVAREMRARLQNVSILFVTGLAEDPGLEGEEVLYKPFKPDRLLDRVRGLLIAASPDF